MKPKRMKPKRVWIAGLVGILAMLIVLAQAAPVFAQHIIIDPPIDRPIPPHPPQPPREPNMFRPIVADAHRVEAVLDGPLATVRVSQVFHNASGRTVEGSYIFPLPPDAAVSDFQMTVNGQTLEGSVMDKDEARGIYERIVRQQRDPALLEFVGWGLFQTSVFPIPPDETRVLELRYSQVLRHDGGLYHFRYPLRGGGGMSPAEQLSVKVEMINQPGLRTLYSPMRDVVIERTGTDSATATLELERANPDSDFDLYFGVAQEAVGLNLLSYRPAGEDGFFLLLAAPDVEVESAQIVQRDIVLVLDVSGSMEGQKMEQAREAAHFLVDHLNPGDRFNLISFSTGVRLWEGELQPVNAETLESARRWIDRLDAGGSTDINRALLEALAQVSGASAQDAARPAYVLFMTDGLPTQGETDAWRIVDNAIANRPGERTLRLFTFGVGYDVNTDLLDTVSRELGGRSSYVRPNERIDEVVGDFYAGVSTPVLSDVRLEIGEGIVIDDVYPYPLPDLFAGEQLVAAGRYREGGDVSVTLHGTVNGEPRTFEFAEQRLASSGGEPFVARLWAMRKIADLIEQIRRSGMSDEALNEIVDLSLQYGIVTPYTSYLVQEPDADSPVAMQPAIPTLPGQPGAEGGVGGGTGGDAAAPSMRDAAKAEAEAGVAAMAAAPASGEAAVAASEDRAEMQEATTTEEYEPVQYVEGKTFVRRGQVTTPDGAVVEFWIDTLYTPDMPVETVAFGGERYFALAQDARWAKWLSVSPEMIVVTDEGSAVRVTLAEVETDATDVTGPVEPSAETSDEDEISIWTVGEYFMYWLGLGPEPK